MYVAHLTLHDFRSHAALDLELAPGVTAFVGRNGLGKTNIVEAIDYLSRLSSHRVATDGPLVREGAGQAVVRAAVVRDGRRAVLEVEINPGKSNRARINKSPLPRARELVGLVRTVLFSPEDLALVKGDPGERRRFADDLLTLLTPRFAGTRADYDRVLKQRNTLLRTAAMARRARSTAGDPLATLDVWDTKLAALGAEIVAARVRLVEDLSPLLAGDYRAVAKGVRRDDAHLAYKASFPLPDDADGVEAALLEEIGRRRQDEVDRGVTLVGPHRDDLVLRLGEQPVKGYASHGESWSFALALRLASYHLLQQDGDAPILILDDVFAELDTGRRSQLAALVADAEQVLITAAVPDDIPDELAAATRFHVSEEGVTGG